MAVQIPADEEAYPLDEVLQRLNITKPTFYRYRRRGWIATFQHGGRTYVKESWIRDYFARRAEEGAKARSKAERAERSRKSA
ncbi:helix-turn-helix domain-containing protein [Amycolatopsis pittospori]|uniref:helix-turn-helix domain-containing protein n=1 Tax=Amycolatopsis pittospori TaxID=2749434 RepID=UPI0015F03EE5|nr:helix-turn-helix domain-containing protein [Amycolatopsis pittospori]